jgi:hypothetical protein
LEGKIAAPQNLHDLIGLLTVGKVLQRTCTIIIITTIIIIIIIMFNEGTHDAHSPFV